jgi:hypothetical protein
MNQRAEDLLMGAPSEVTAKQLRELHIRVVTPDRPVVSHPPITSGASRSDDQS